MKGTEKANGPGPSTPPPVVWPWASRLPSLAWRRQTTVLSKVREQPETGKPLDTRAPGAGAVAITKAASLSAPSERSQPSAPPPGALAQPASTTAIATNSPRIAVVLPFLNALQMSSAPSTMTISRSEPARACGSTAW